MLICETDISPIIADVSMCVCLNVSNVFGVNEGEIHMIEPSSCKQQDADNST